MRETAIRASTYPWVNRKHDDSSSPEPSQAPNHPQARDLGQTIKRQKRRTRPPVRSCLKQDGQHPAAMQEYE
jgi:hypothetical protein